MTATTPPDAPDLPSLAGTPWLVAASTRAVLAALADAGFPARVVGGAVRNTLMGLPVADIDVATPARPEQVVSAVEAAGLAAIPTGVEHGTVTVVADHKPIEVTTLRRDVTTDGRRATVAFTDDWAEDAKRRDFTMNALYCDGAGRLFDPVGGLADIRARQVRFIGFADERIAEDYLRILRFFRFHAAYATGAPDSVAMGACARGLGGVSRLSAERIRGELVKLLVAPGAIGSVAAMTDIGLLVHCLGSAPRPGILAAIVRSEAAAGAMPDAMLRLSALALAVNDDISRLAGLLRLSVAERHSLLVIDDSFAERLDVGSPRGARRHVYSHGATAARRHAIALEALRPSARAAALTLRDTAENWQPPRLPVGGGDLLRRGLAPGPQIGKLLSEIEGWWIESDFPGSGAVEAELAALLARRHPAQ